MNRLSSRHPSISAQLGRQYLGRSSRLRQPTMSIPIDTNTWRSASTAAKQSCEAKMKSKYGGSADKNWMTTRKASGWTDWLSGTTGKQKTEIRKLLIWCVWQHWPEPTSFYHKSDSLYNYPHAEYWIFLASLRWFLHIYLLLSRFQILVATMAGFTITTSLSLPF